MQEILVDKTLGIETVEEGLQQRRMPSKMIDGEFRLGLP